jgi:hypothetical protein
MHAALPYAPTVTVFREISILFFMLVSIFIRKQSLGRESPPILKNIFLAIIAFTQYIYLHTITGGTAS